MLLTSKSNGFDRIVPPSRGASRPVVLKRSWGTRRLIGFFSWTYLLDWGPEDELIDLGVSHFSKVFDPSEDVMLDQDDIVLGKEVLVDLLRVLSTCCGLMLHHLSDFFF